MEASLVRILSAKFWSRGANFSSFYIPPRVISIPSGRRLDLGNWSSLYYKVSNYTMIAPVVGFMAYDSPNEIAIGNQKLNFTADGNPITILFPRIDAAQGETVTRKCVQFGDGGTFEITNMTSENECITRGLGHFSVVVPSPPAPEPALTPGEKKGTGNGLWLELCLYYHF